MSDVNFKSQKCDHLKFIKQSDDCLPRLNPDKRLDSRVLENDTFENSSLAAVSAASVQTKQTQVTHRSLGLKIGWMKWTSVHCNDDRYKGGLVFMEEKMF